MEIFKERLPNGNVFMWLGTGYGWKENESGIDKVIERAELAAGEAF